MNYEDLKDAVKWLQTDPRPYEDGVVTPEIKALFTVPEILKRDFLEYAAVSTVDEITHAGISRFRSRVKGNADMWDAIEDIPSGKQTHITADVHADFGDLMDDFHYKHIDRYVQALSNATPKEIRAQATGEDMLTFLKHEQDWVKEWQTKHVKSRGDSFVPGWVETIPLRMRGGFRDEMTHTIHEMASLVDDQPTLKLACEELQSILDGRMKFGDVIESAPAQAYLNISMRDVCRLWVFQLAEEIHEAKKNMTKSTTTKYTLER